MLVSMVLTAFIAPVVNAVVVLIETSGSIANPSSGFETGFGFLIFTFFGLIFAFPSAIVLGCLIELPKANLLGRCYTMRSWVAFSIQLLVSVLGVLPLMVATNAILMLIFRSSEPLYSQIFIPFMIGGLVSAITWWSLVVLPLRRIRMLEASGKWGPEPHQSHLTSARRGS